MQNSQFKHSNFLLTHKQQLLLITVLLLDTTGFMKYLINTQTYKIIFKYEKSNFCFKAIMK